VSFAGRLGGQNSEFTLPAVRMSKRRAASRRLGRAGLIKVKQRKIRPERRSA